MDTTPQNDLDAQREIIRDSLTEIAERHRYGHARRWPAFSRLHDRAR